MASQKMSQSSSSGSSSGGSLELQQHQPSLDHQPYQQRSSNSSSGSFGDQPGSSGLQAGSSGLQAGPSGLQAARPSGLQAGPSGLQDNNSMEFPSQELDDFDMMVREEGASTHRYPTGRKDAGARSGDLSDDHREAEVPHTETSVSASSEDDTAVVPRPSSQQSQSQPVQQHSGILDDNGSLLSDVSQASFKVPSVDDSASTSSCDHTVPRKKSRKRSQPENDGIDFSPPMMSSSSSSSSGEGRSHHRHPARGLLGGYIDSTSESSVDATSTTSSGESGSSVSQDGDTSSGQHGGNVASSLVLSASTSQSLSMLGFSQPQEESSCLIPATPESLELLSVSSDIISSTPDEGDDGSSQELIRSTADDQLRATRYKRERSYDGDDDASSLDEVPPKRQRFSSLVTSASATSTANPSASPLSQVNQTEFKTPSMPVLKKSKSGSSSGGSISGSGAVTSSSGSSSTTPYPSGCGTSSSGIGQSSSSLSSSDTENVERVESTPVPAIQLMPQLDTSKEDLKDVSTGSHDTTIELSQSLDATMSQDMIADTLPPSLPVEDNEFNLHLSNTTTVTQCSAASQELEESQAESQTATTSSSSSSEQTVEETPTPEDHVTSPSPSPDDNNDGATGGRGSNSGEPDDDNDDQGQMEKDDNQESKDSNEKSGESDRQEQNEENYSCTIIDPVQPLTETAHMNKDATKDATSTTKLESGQTAEDDQQEDHDQEDNSCIIVDAILSSPTEAADQKESTTSSEFELGIVTSSGAHLSTSDSPIKVPKVTEEFSQDAFSQLNIRAPNTNNTILPVHPISSMRPQSSLLETVRADIRADSVNNTDPFEFQSQDEFIKKKKVPKLSKISSSQCQQNNNQKVIVKEKHGLVTESQPAVTENHSPLVVDEQPTGMDKQPIPVEQQPAVDGLQSSVTDEQVPIVEQSPVNDRQSLVADQQPQVIDESPIRDKPSSVTYEQPITDEQPITEQSVVESGQSFVADKGSQIVEQSLIDQQPPVADGKSPIAEKQSPVANANVMDVSHDMDDMDHLNHNDDDDDDEMTSLAMETEHNSDITPSEHGQVVDRSSEDPINTGASRSEIASTTESSPRTSSEVAHSQEHHSRTTIYTTVTVVTQKKFIEEQLVNDQWVTTDEYQEEQDPVIEETKEVRYITSYPPKTVPFQDTSISSSFSASSTPKVSQRSSSRRRCSTTSNKRSERSSDTPTNSQGRVSRPEDSSPTITQEGSSSSRMGQVTPQLGQMTPQLGQLTPQPGSLQCADDRVLARWKDGQWYPGTVQENLSNGKYVILFDDGDKKVLAKSSVIQMSLLKVGSEVMVLTEEDDYLRGSITGRCTVSDEPGYLINTGGREPLRCPESDLKLTQALVKQLTSAGPSPAASPAVRSKRNILTTPLSSKKRTSSSPTVSTTGSSSLLFSELLFLITGEGKSSQSLGDQIIASGGVVLSEFPIDVCPSKTFLLADKPRRTAKYLLALAGGVPCIQPTWAKDCLKQNRLLDYTKYLLPAGKCCKTNRMIQWSPREPKTILSRLRIFLKGNGAFKKLWEPIVLAAGGRLVSRLSYSNEAGSDCDLVLCQEGVSGETLRRAQNLQLSCISVEWAVQCLITGEQLDYSSFLCT